MRERKQYWIDEEFGHILKKRLDSPRAYSDKLVKVTTLAPDERVISKDELDTKLHEIIMKWKTFWMNQTQNSEADHQNYLRRALGVDANMKYHLIDLIKNELFSEAKDETK